MPHYESTIPAGSGELMDTDSKIGVLATTDEEGYPHLTFISSIQAVGKQQLAWGKFSNGLSKRFICERPDAGFLALSADKRFVRGFARYTHQENTGEVFDLYNQKPLFRYNSYMGFSSVFFMDLVGVTKPEPLPMGKIILGAILSRIKALCLKKSGSHALPTIGKRLFSELDSLKFLSVIDAAGRLSIIPIVQATAAGTDRIVFVKTPFEKELQKIPDGAKAAILCVTMKMESMLVKGTYHNGVLDIKRVYNSMPPKMEYIYPREAKMQPIRDF